MKHIKSFNIFESAAGLGKEQEEFLNKFTGGSWRWDAATGLVNVVGDFECDSQKLIDFKGVRFGEVSGRFFCYNNDLVSLEGAPQTVGGGFYCSNNELVSLKGGPQTVRKGFRCSFNRITSLVGGPQSVGGAFSCYNNNSLRSLEGAPQTLGGEFYSDELKVPEGKWSIEYLIELFLEATGKKKNLLATIVSPEVLQQKIDENPEKMAVGLKSLLKLPLYASLKFPARLQKEVDLIRDLSDVGL